MRKILSFFLTTILGIGMLSAATTRIYCKNAQSWWLDAGAGVNAHCFLDADNKMAAWPGTAMTAVDGEENMWYIDVDITAYPNIVFVRSNGTEDWGAQTEDLVIPTDGRNLYTITSTTAQWMNQGHKVAGEWSEYGKTHVYAKSNWAGAEEWTWKELILNEVTSRYELANLVYGGAGMNIDTKMEDSNESYLNNDAIKAANGSVEVAKFDTISLSYDLSTKTLTVKVTGKYVAPADPETYNTLRFVPNVWAQADAKIAAWIWGEKLAGQFTAFFEGEGDTLSVKVNTKADSILFVRFNSALTEPKWNTESEKGNEWTRVDKEKINTESLVFTIIGWKKGTWDVYVPDYGIMVNDKDYHAGVKNEDYTGEGTEYKVVVTLAKDDKIQNYDNFAKVASLIALDEKGYKFNKEDNHYVVTEAGEYTFYIKIIDDVKDNMFVAKKEEVVTNDYGILVNDNNYIAGVRNEEFQGGDEYKVTATLNAGDKFQNYNNVKKEAWMMELDPKSYKFTDEDNHYVVSTTGEYTFYIKLIPGNDNMYVSLKSDCGIMVNDKDYSAAVIHEGYEGAGAEYMVTVKLAAGDKIQNYDNGNKAASLVALDQSGYQFTTEAGYYVVTEAGEYTFYIKVIGAGKDNMFVAKTVEITRVDYTLLNAGELAKDNAKMFIHTRGDGMADEDILMTAVMDGEVVVGYKAAINDLTQNLVFVRMNPEAEAINLENNWGKSDNLARCDNEKAYFAGWIKDQPKFNVTCDAPTDVEIVEQPANSGKIIENGVLYILRDGKRYNAQGVEVK